MGKKSEFKYEVAKTAQKIGISKAAELYSVSRKSVGIWLKKYLIDGIKALDNAKKPQLMAEKRMKPEIEAGIIRLKHQNPKMSATEIKKQLNLDYSLVSVCKKIRDAGLTNIKTAKTNSFLHLHTGFRKISALDIDLWLFYLQDLGSGLLFTALAKEKSATHAAVWLDCFLSYYFTNQKKSKTANIITISGGKSITGCLKLVEDRYSNLKLFAEEPKEKPDLSAITNLIKAVESAQNLSELIRDLSTKQLVYNYQINSDNLIFKELIIQLIPMVIDDFLSGFIQGRVPKINSKQQQETYQIILDQLLIESDSAFKKSDLISAENLCKLILELDNLAPNATRQLISLRRLGLIYQRRGIWEYAKKYLMQAYKLTMQNDDAVQRAHTAGMLAAFYLSWGDLVQAIVYAKIQLEIAEHLNNPVTETLACQHLGVISKKSNRHKAAIKYYQRILELVEITGDISVKARTMGNLGVIYYKQNKLNKAREFYEEAIFLTEKTGNQREAARLYNNLGIIDEEQDRIKAALLCYQKMLDWSVANHNPNWQIAAQINIGSLQFLIGDYQQSLKNLQQAESLCVKYQQQENLSLALINLSQVYQALKLVSKAQIQIKKAIKLASESENDYHLASFYLEQAGIDFLGKKYLLAKENLDKSIQSAAKSERVDLADSQSLWKLKIDYQLAINEKEKQAVLLEMHNIYSSSKNKKAIAEIAYEITMILQKETFIYEKSFNQGVIKDGRPTGIAPTTIHSLGDWINLTSKLCLNIYQKTNIKSYKDKYDELININAKMGT